MTKIFLALILVFLSSASAIAGSNTDYSNNKELQSPMSYLPYAIEWNKMWEEFEITGKVRICGSGLETAIGFESKMIEFTGFFEVVSDKYNFAFAQNDADGMQQKRMAKRKAQKNAKKTTIGEDVEEFFSRGVSRMMAGNIKGYSHLIKFPIMGMVMKELTGGIICFESDPFSIPYIGELAMDKYEFLQYKLMGEVIPFFTPQGVVGAAISCAAATADNAYGEATKYGSLARNSFIYAVGCQGPLPIGWNVSSGDDPMSGSMAHFARVVHLMHKTTLLKKKINWAPGLDSMCGPKVYPAKIDSQYGLQIMYPSIGPVVEVGTTPTVWTTLKNIQGSGDDVVFGVWERRHYAAFAYSCGSSKSKK